MMVGVLYRNTVEPDHTLCKDSTHFLNQKDGHNYFMLAYYVIIGISNSNKQKLKIDYVPLL